MRACGLKGIAIRAGAVILGALAVASADEIVNPGFEEGDFSGWQLNDPAWGGVAASTYGLLLDADEQGSYYTAIEGNFLAYVLGSATPSLHTLLSQSFTLASGQSIHGWAGFQVGDIPPHNDQAYLDLLDGTGMRVERLFFAQVADYEYDYSDLKLPQTGWVPWEFTSPADGSYQLVLGVVNGDGRCPSYAVLDGIGIPDAGSTVLLLMAGFMAVVGSLGVVRPSRSV